MQKELNVRNAMELAEYEEFVAMHPLRVAEWNALPAAGKDPAPVPPAPAPPVVNTLYWDPLGQLWELFGRLYPERSSSRIKEYRDFKPLPGESTPNMVNRLDLLHIQIGGQELQAVTKLLDALRKDMRTAVQQKLLARFAHTDDWTVRRAGDIMEEIVRNAAELSLYTGKSIGSGEGNNNAPGKSGSAPAARSDQRTCHQCGKVGHVKRTCPDLNLGAFVNARYANAPAKHKGQDLSNVECYTCHKKGHYSNKCSERQPGGALGTRQDGKPRCSHHQTNTHSSEECKHLHPHLKDQGCGRQKGKGKRSNARSAEAANSGGSSTPSGAQLQEMFAAFMLTQNAASADPRREDSYSGSVVELKVPVTPMSDTDQSQICAGTTPWRSPTLQARVAATTLTRKEPERQRLAGPQSKMPLGFLQQGPLTFRLREGEEEPKKDAKIDAEAVSKGTGEPDETMPEPEEPAGTKPGLQELPGTKNGSPGGRQTRSKTGALLRANESGVGKSKSSIEMSKGFEELPPTDPQYQGIQGFSFGDFPPLRGEVSKDTTSNMTIRTKEAPSRDIENVEKGD
jgi:hypothetical protein